MGLFLRRKAKAAKSYDPDTQKPVLKCSICNGEQLAGFVDLKGGAFTEVCFIAGPEDLKRFKQEYGITGEITKIY